MTSLIDFCLRYRFLVLALTGILIVGGLFSLGQLTIDAVPDITPVQVQILSRSPTLGPVEVVPPTRRPSPTFPPTRGDWSGYHAPP